MYLYSKISKLRLSVKDDIIRKEEFNNKLEEKRLLNMSNKKMDKIIDYSFNLILIVLLFIWLMK